MQTYLALGDSYTIGEGVPLFESYPYQTVQLLRRAGHHVFAPEIIARTGWTTDELADGISRTALLPHYDIVTLLIGVNNQYRGRSPEEYSRQFGQLLQQAIGLSRTGGVFVLSIPDWGVSPFAAARDPVTIAAEIDAFNALARKISGEKAVPFIDVTAYSRGEGAAPDSFTADGLHPAGSQYAWWAAQLKQAILTNRSA